MKKKIISLLLIITLISSNTLCVYAEEKQSRSVLAMSGATATAILTLATYAGFQFHDSESVDEFLRRMCGIEQFAEVVTHVSALVKHSVDGTIEFTSDLINDFKVMFNRIALTKELQYVTDSKGYSLPVITTSISTNSTKLNAFLHSSPKKIFSMNTGNANVTNTINFGNGSLQYSVRNMEVNGSRNLYPISKCHGNVGSTFSELRNNCSYTNGTSLSDRGYLMAPAVIEQVISGKKNTHFAIVRANASMGSDGKLGYTSASFSYCSSHTVEREDSYTKILNTTIGTSWTDGEGTIDSNNSSGGVSLKIPSDMGSIIDKTPSDVSNPTYDLWTPGLDVSIPEISNPSLEYTPDKSTDTPGDDVTTDTPTTNPGFPDFGDIPKVDLDLTPLRNGLGKLTERFPFSLPWDLQRIAQSFGGQPNALAIGQAPVVNMNFNGHKLILDFAKFEPVAMIIRGFIFTEVAIGLIFVLRKLKP